jgi:hypothetical protein
LAWKTNKLKEKPHVELFDFGFINCMSLSLSNQFIATGTTAGYVSVYGMEGNNAFESLFIHRLGVNDLKVIFENNFVCINNKK